MGINKLLVPVFFLAGAVLAFSQTKPGPVLLTAETAAVKGKLADAKLPQAERKTALETMARLFELSGNVEGAAEAWLEAASAGPGTADHNALFRAARSFAALGEFDRAAAALKPILDSAENSARNRARFLAAQIEAFAGGGAGRLGGLAADPAFAEYRAAAYYTLWRVSGDTSARSRLLAEFPRSPEARIVRAEENGSPGGNNGTISAAPAALWLLAGSFPFAAANQAQAPVSASPAAPAAPGASPAARNDPSMFQTGLFGREENARALAERLRGAGFNPVINKKSINGTERWVVGVAPGPDPSRTLALLKSRGFEAFPVY